MITEQGYPLSFTNGIWTHFGGVGRPALVRDGLDEEDTMRAQARVRSGDYFLTLATELDKLAQTIASVDGPEAEQIERLVSELLYVHKHYQTVKKS